MENKIEEIFNADYELPIVSWEQYFNIIVRERAFQLVEQYVAQTGFDAVPHFDPEGKATESTDSLYERSFQLVQELKTPVEDVRKQFLDQLKKVESQVFASDFQDSIELAAMDALEKFVELERSVVVDMGNEEYILAPTSKDHLVLRMIDFVQGTLIVYTPCKFIKFQLPKKSP
jgi:hypothetical protein